MRLTDLFDRGVRDAEGRLLGRVVDARFVLDGPPSGNGSGALADARLHGLLVSPKRSGSFLGYERTGETRPWLIAHFLAWRERRAVLVLWRDVASVGDELQLRPGATLYSPALPTSR
jgi:hypothetical protein